tara:strand:- start:908 stop:1504 length:597 start_codon:yes stop_codon:yes gene_type:complete
MGYIYMADVVTFEGYSGVKVGRAKDLKARLSQHYNDPQWRQFNLLKAWAVGDEAAAESSLLTQLKSYGRPIHGRETFCHSISPVRITRMAMGDVVGDSHTSRSWWEVEKLWNGLACFNRIYSRRKSDGLYNLLVFVAHLAMVAVCTVFAIVVGVIGVVEHIIVPVVGYLMKKWKERVATKNRNALERAINRFNDARGT